MSEQLKVSSSPHIRSKETTGNIMLWVIIALLPATFFGIYNFRDTHAWLLVIVTTAAAVLTEYIYEKLMHKKITIKDFSYRTSACTQPSADSPDLDGNHRKCIRDPGCKAALWWIGTELHEPCTWSKMFPSYFLHRKNDKLRI